MSSARTYFRCRFACLIACLFVGLMGVALPAPAQSHFTLDVYAGDVAPGALPKAAFAELVEHLDNTLAARFTLRVITTRRLLEASMSDASPPHFVLTDGVQPLPSTEFTVLHLSPERLSAVFLVLQDSPLKSIVDLQGRKVLANREHAVGTLGTRLLERRGIAAQLGGGSRMSEEALARHYAQYPGRDALLTSLHAAEALLQRHPGRFRLLPEQETAPRWVLAGRKSLADGVSEGLLVNLQETSAGLSPATRKLLPSFRRAPRDTLTTNVTLGR